MLTPPYLPPTEPFPGKLNVDNAEEVTPRDIGIAVRDATPEKTGVDDASSAADTSGARVNIAEAEKVTPPPMGADDKGDGGRSPPGSLASAPAVTPDQPRGLSAGEMPPVAAAGVKLAMIVLAIAASSIALLLGYLLTMDLTVGSDVRDAYRQLLTPSRVGAELFTLASIDRLAADLTASRKDPTVQFTPDSTKNLDNVIALLKQLPGLTSLQKNQLGACVPPSSLSPTSETTQQLSDQNRKIDECLSLLDSMKQTAIEFATDMTTGQLAADSTSKMDDQRQHFHVFWIQAAQLILLNLLLPLLTALFGYVFGTQHAQSR
jgi:hypothetical protein